MRIGDVANDEKVVYSYVIFKKGIRSDDKTIDWPRIIRPVQVRPRHTRCKLCTHRGKLENVIITKRKHSKYVNSTFEIAEKTIFNLFVFSTSDTPIAVPEKVNGVIGCQLSLRKMMVI